MKLFPNFAYFATKPPIIPFSNIKMALNKLAIHNFGLLSLTINTHFSFYSPASVASVVDSQIIIPVAEMVKVNECFTLIKRMRITFFTRDRFLLLAFDVCARGINDEVIKYV